MIKSLFGMLLLQALCLLLAVILPLIVLIDYLTVRKPQLTVWVKLSEDWWR